MSMKKKILIFSLAYYPKFVGGAEVAIKEITDRIDDIEFHLITNRFDTDLQKVEEIGNVVVHRVGFSKHGVDTKNTHHFVFYLQKVLFIPQAVVCGWQLHKKHRFDGMWAMMAYMMFPIVLMRLFRVKVPYVVTLQEGDPFEHVFKRWYITPFVPLLRYGFRNAVSVQTISHFLKEWALEMGAKSVEVVPNAVDVAHFSSEPKRVDVGKKEGDVWLIHTGRFVHKNALEEVIKALVELDERVHFFLIGEGPLEEEYLVLAESLGVEKRVHLHPYVDLTKIPSYLHVCDVFIRPSRSEGMGNSFLEAMAAGLPVIATTEGGIADFLVDGETGWAVSVDSPSEIAESVEDIMNNTEKVERVVGTAKEMVREKYDWSIIARDMRERVLGKV